MTGYGRHMAEHELNFEHPGAAEDGPVHGYGAVFPTVDECLARGGAAAGLYEDPPKNAKLDRVLRAARLLALALSELDAAG